MSEKLYDRSYHHAEFKRSYMKNIQEMTNVTVKVLSGQRMCQFKEIFSNEASWALLIAMECIIIKEKKPNSSFSVNLWSSLSKTDVSKSGKHSHDHCLTAFLCLTFSGSLYVK